MNFDKLPDGKVLYVTLSDAIAITLKRAGHKAQQETISKTSQLVNKVILAYYALQRDEVVFGKTVTTLQKAIENLEVAKKEFTRGYKSAHDLVVAKELVT